MSMYTQPSGPVHISRAIRDLLDEWPGDPDVDLRMDLESQVDYEGKKVVFDAIEAER